MRPKLAARSGRCSALRKEKDLPQEMISPMQKDNRKLQVMENICRTEAVPKCRLALLAVPKRN